MKSLCAIKPWVLAIISALLLAGCSGPDLIIVDMSGKPIAGAKVIGASLSMGGQITLSDKKGHAKVPWSVQETKWVSIHKDGFLPVENINVAQKKPIVVKMIKTDK